MGQGFYLYCLARLSLLPQHLEGVGLDGIGPLYVAGFRDLAAVFSPVALDDFCGPEASERFQDLSWISPRAIRHQEVVMEVMRRSPVMPAHFGTIFASKADLEQVLQRRYATLAAILERLTNREEWAVKGLLDRQTAKDRLFARELSREAPRLEPLPPDKRYFEEQRLRAACDRELPRWMKEVRQQLHTDLLRYAVEARERRLLSRQNSGSELDMVFNWAFLLPARSIDAFQTRIQAVNAAYADLGLTLERTGPWPPYSFCPALDQEPAG